MSEISPSEVQVLLEREPKEFVLLDCREVDEVRIATIRGSINIPMGEIPSRITSLDPDMPIVVYCHYGVRSANVAEFLRKQDFRDVKNMSGGIDAWSRQVDPSVPLY